MKKILAYFLIGLVGGGPLIAETTWAALSKAKENKPQAFLFTLEADAAEITQGSDGLQLELKKPNETIPYFTDRAPISKVGDLSLIQLMDTWKKGGSNFQLVTPNATLLHLTPINMDTPLILGAILSNPEATAEGWRFKVQLLNGNLVPGSYKKVSLYIDALIIIPKDQKSKDPVAKFNPFEP